MSCCTLLHGLGRMLVVFVPALFLSLAPLSGQMTGITVEAIANHDTTGIAALAGHTTYRFYAEFTNPTDKVSAVYGDASAPLTLSSSNGFYNAMFGGDFAMDVNPALFSFFFETAYDSWFTIGFAPGNSPTSNLTAVGLAAQLANFNQNGQMDLGDAIGGSYFTTDDPHAVAGSDLRVLLGQLTTDGTFTGVFNVQVFVEGSSSNEQLAEAVVFTNATSVPMGCTDPLATNFDAEALLDDGSCTYPCALELTASPNAATCPGGDDGSVSLSVTGQQFEVFYGLDGSEPTQLLSSFNGLSAGEHTVVAMDGLGCTDEVTFTVESPTAFELMATSVAAVCDGPGGAVTVSATGGTAPYAYTLNGVTNTHGAFAYVTAGPHNVTLVDSEGCSAILPIDVVGVSEATATVIAEPSCTQPNGGQVALLLNGLVPLEVEWLTAAEGIVLGADGSVSGLTAGTYSAVLTSNTCSDTVSWEMTLDTNLDAFSAVVTDASCAGAIDGSVAFSGPDANWEISWSGGNAGWTSEGVTGLAAGGYAFTVSRGAACAYNAEVMVGEPEPLVWSVTSTNPQCEGDATGSISAAVSGGTAPWTWTVNGSAAEPFSGEADLANLNPGTYSLAVQDANGCTAQYVTVISWPQPVPTPGILVVEPTTYANGSATALVDPSYAVEWTTAAGEVLGTDLTLDGLAAGSVHVTVTNAIGCSSTAEAVIPFAGCAAVGAADWPENPEGWYPVGVSTALLDSPYAEEWVLQFPEAVTPPTAEVTLPVTAFLPNSISGLPAGLEAVADFSQAIPVDGAWCLELAGTPTEVGTFAVTVTGTYYIEFFGSIFPAPGFSYMKALVVSEAEDLPVVEGCTYAWASNFNPNASVDDGTCAILGCLDAEACNFQPLATLSGGCDYACKGCTYADADNYDATATQDDGSCSFPAGGDPATCMWDGDGNSYINSSDLLLFLGHYDSPCE